MKNTALMVSGIIFLLVAMMHAARIIYHVEIMAAGRVVPLGLSVFGFLFAILISAWMFCAEKGKSL
jgi:hypothetical protein